ncbi:MAG: hypothetical protein IJM79_08730 [Erysipelotrichaceae bacterium]|nr:hypothetical protein [Erysipelotrichaceae bacterium]
MFTNKDEFKKQFCERLVQTYGRSAEKCDPTEKYLILGEMIRDYAAESWMNCKEAVTKNEEKQVFYFSMEFLMGRLLTNNKLMK